MLNNLFIIFCYLKILLIRIEGLILSFRFIAYYFIITPNLHCTLNFSYILRNIGKNLKLTVL